MRLYKDLCLFCLFVLSAFSWHLSRPPSNCSNNWVVGRNPSTPVVLFYSVEHFSWGLLHMIAHTLIMVWFIWTLEIYIYMYKFAKCFDKKKYTGLTQVFRSHDTAPEYTLYNFDCSGQWLTCWSRSMRHCAVVIDSITEMDSEENQLSITSWGEHRSDIKGMTKIMTWMTMHYHADDVWFDVVK